VRDRKINKSELNMNSNKGKEQIGAIMEESYKISEELKSDKKSTS
jgi:hypothetical protein